MPKHRGKEVGDFVSESGRVLSKFNGIFVCFKVVSWAVCIDN